MDNRYLAGAAIVSVAAFALAGCVGPPPRINVENDAAGAARLQSEIVFSEVGHQIDEGSGPPDVLTIDDAIRRSVLGSPQVQSSIARVRQAQATSRQARLLPNPVLSIAVRFPEHGGKPTIDAGLTADLIAVLSRPGQSRAADNRLRAAAADAVTTVLDVVSDIQERYVVVQTNEALLVVLQDRAGIVERLLGISRSRLELGAGTRLDVLALEAQLVELQTLIRERQLDRQDQRLALARLIGEPSGTTDWKISPWRASRLPDLSESKWVTASLQARPEVQQQRFALAALGDELRLAGYAPFDSAEVGADSERDGDWSLGPAVSTPIPLFDFGQARREQAKAAVIEARHDLTRVRRQVVEETRRAHAAFVATRENMERVRTELIPLTQRRLDQAEAQFRGGQTDVTGLLQAEEELRAARTRLVELERSNADALIRLERAVGGRAVMSVAEEPATQTSGVAKDQDER